jgi:hypothetical protein
MRKNSRPKTTPFKHPAKGALRRQSIRGDVTPEDRKEIDSDFDTVEIEDVVRQARNGRIEISELDAF